MARPNASPRQIVIQAHPDTRKAVRQTILA